MGDFLANIICWWYHLFSSQRCTPTVDVDTTFRKFGKWFSKTLILFFNKIGHSSRSSSIQRRKTTADQRCLVMLNNFEKFSFPSIEKRWTKEKETHRQKEKQIKRKKTRKKTKKVI